MKGKFFFGLFLTFAAELAALLIFAARDTGSEQDAVLVNEAVQSVQANWDAIEGHRNRTGLDYVVLAPDGAVLFKTREGLSESENMAVLHRDTMLDLFSGGLAVGKIIIYNDSERSFQARRQADILVLAAAMLVQCGICAGCGIYMNRAVIRPFRKLKAFAERIAGGNLDIPLEMDRQNLFGAFTESFDIMRDELKKARLAEARANADKKELVAKLSHDIKTPVASIKAASEVGAALAVDERSRENYEQIIRKADQINILITNLFTATLEELEQLSVTPEAIKSGELKGLLENSDYFHRAALPDIPGCILYADRLRLQQVFDNLFINSYKYADTPVYVSAALQSGRLSVSIEDEGGGVEVEELPLIKEKFRRGSNAGEAEGAGLGLYISDYFMKEMGGGLAVSNGENGLRVTVSIAVLRHPDP